MKNLSIILLLFGAISTAICQEIPSPELPPVNKDTVITAIDQEFISSSKVYPNPYKDKVIIESAQNTKVVTMDFSGKPVDLNNVSAGIYLVQFQDSRNKYTVRVIKY